MKRRKFDVVSNPFGIVFNPISIAKTIHRCLQSQTFTKDDIFADEHDSSLYHSWDHHSSFSGIDPHMMIEHMNQRKDQALDFLQTVDVMIITLGTAFVHQLKDTDQIVANCHKRKKTELTQSISSNLNL